MGNIWLHKFWASGPGWTEFLLGQGLIGCRQLSGPEGPQVLAWQRVGSGRGWLWTLEPVAPGPGWEGPGPGSAPRGVRVSWLKPGPHSASPSPGAQGWLRCLTLQAVATCLLLAPRASHSFPSTSWVLGSCFPKRLSSSSHPHRSSSASLLGCVLKFLFYTSSLI